MGKLGDNPYIVSIYDVGEERGQPYIVSQYMAGGSVDDLLRRAANHRIVPADAMRIACDVCRALDYAHSRGIIHRDLKPANVWLTADGITKLGDFGLAIASDRTRLTAAGMIVGTAAYLPPEQALGKPLDARSDLYSLGAMLYEMLSGAAAVSRQRSAGGHRAAHQCGARTAFEEGRGNPARFGRADSEAAREKSRPAPA